MQGLRASRLYPFSLLQAMSKAGADSARQNLQQKLEDRSQQNLLLKQQVDVLAGKVSALAGLNSLAAKNMEKLLFELAKANLLADQERKLKEHALQENSEQETRYRELERSKQEVLLNLQSERFLLLSLHSWFCVAVFGCCDK